MYNNGPKIWEATIELRWVDTPHGSRLQRKRTEHLPTCVIIGDGDDARPLPGYDHPGPPLALPLRAR